MGQHIERLVHKEIGPTRNSQRDGTTYWVRGLSQEENNLFTTSITFQED